VDLSVLVVDDDFRVADLHARAVAAVAGFTVLATAGSCAQARLVLARRRAQGLPPPDLALVDVYLPDGSGLDLVAELDCDALVLSAATETATVRRALRRGALGYLIKPFDEAALAGRLRGYARYRRLLDARPGVDQDVVDGAVRALHSEAAPARGAESATRELVLQALTGAGEPLSAADVAAATGISRATAQRHLATLDAEGRLQLQLRYGTTGRPEQRYAPREH